MPSVSATASSAPRRPIRSNGSDAPTAVLDVGRTATGPASYATGGFEVDLSASYSSLKSVLVASANDGRQYEVDATDFTTGKFKLKAKNPRAAATPTGTNSTPTFTGSALGTHTHGSVTCGGGHVSGTCTYNGGAISAGTPAGTVSAPTFTGDAIAAAVAAEVAATTNLSASTVAYWVVGVPV